MTQPFLLSLAPNGAKKTKADHPSLPITPAELAETAKAAVRAGCALLHLHVRDENSRHSLSPAHYRPALAAIKQAVGDDLVIQITTEAQGVYQPAEQRAVVEELRPEAVSLSLKELAPRSEDEAGFAAFLQKIQVAGTWPQIILYSAEELSRFEGMIDQGLLPDRAHALLFVLGRYSADQQSQPSDLVPFLQALKRPHFWSLCAFGKREADCALAAAARGGHARVGFENNLLLPNGAEAPDNAALLDAVTAGLGPLGRSPMTAAWLRDQVIRAQTAKL